jgi:hypothetical protein
MSGTGASNLGYGNITPLSNINGNYVNTYNTNNPANFTSKTIPGFPGLSGTKNNVDAAAGKTPGICLFKGGALKRKIKNISKKYMKRKSHIRRTKRKLTKYALRKKSHRRSNGRRKSLRGGYSQYQSNVPNTPSYSVGGILGAKDLGLANPPPIKVMNNCVDNYNHYTNKGFAS